MFLIRPKFALTLSLLFFACCSVLAAGIAGTWSGTSICTIKDSPCHDENVIYHITEPDPAGRLQIQADKIVNGKPDDMGTLDCTFDAKSSTITCLIDKGKFEFKVTGDKMSGTLVLTDGRLFRNINLTKDK
ncbi:MAG: hypothetical protein ACKVQJ_00475 [Pyrinomonadaceae bacterium]